MHSQLEIVGEAADGEEAVRQALRLSPDVVLMDISMPKLGGLEATRRLRQQVPKVRVLVLSVHSSRDWILRAIRAGAHGFISKEASLEELLRAIKLVQVGQPLFSPEIAQAALQYMVQNRGKNGTFEQLTPREREVVALISEGKGSKEIATQLGLSVRTIETHRERIMSRLDIHSVAGLTRFAVACGLVPLEVLPAGQMAPDSRVLAQSPDEVSKSFCPSSVTRPAAVQASSA